jgi:hypothetical protein
MIGSGAGAAAGAGAGLAAAAFFSGTANSTSARATDATLTSSRLTHTIDLRFMTSSFLGVERTGRTVAVLGGKDTAFH